MNAIRRLLAMPLFILGLWLIQLGFATSVGVAAYASARAAVGEFAPVTEGHLLYYLAELSSSHPSVVTAALTAVVSSAAVGLVLWTVVSGLVIARLAGVTTAAELGRVWVGTLPGVVVQSVWHLLIRGFLWFVAIALASALPPAVALVLLVGVAGGSTAALDLARIGVVQHDAAMYHPRTAAMAFVAVAKRPKVWLAVAGLWVLQVGVMVTMLCLGLRGMGNDAALAPVRLLTLVATAIGVFRMSVLVGVGAVPLGVQAQPATAED